jgi:hypothetical protein
MLDDKSKSETECAMTAILAKGVNAVLTFRAEG